MKRPWSDFSIAPDRPFRPLVTVLGPTASGKSKLAEFLASQVDGELLNSDASAVYTELSVGVTKPCAEVRSRLRYHLLDLTTLERGFNLMEYLDCANSVIDDVLGRGRLPILVGGSSLYVRALLDGYRPPPVEVTESLREEVRALPIESALEKLLQHDPEAYQRVDRANPRRVTRALELTLAYGGPLPPPVNEPRRDLDILRFYLLPDRALLKERIRQRTEEMWDGWLEEVDQLEKNGQARWLDVRKPIGYEFVRSFRSEELNREQAIDAIVRATVKLAKKQRTWLKREVHHPQSYHFTLTHEKEWSQVPVRALERLQDFLKRGSEKL